MKTAKTIALAKAIATILPFLYVTLAFGGLLCQHYLPLAGHITFAIAEAIFLTVILYHEVLAEELPQEKTPQHLAQAKYGWGQ